MYDKFITFRAKSKQSAENILDEISTENVLQSEFWRNAKSKATKIAKNHPNLVRMFFYGEADD